MYHFQTDLCWKFVQTLNSLPSFNLFCNQGRVKKKELWCHEHRRFIGLFKILLLLWPFFMNLLWCAVRKESLHICLTANEIYLTMLAFPFVIRNIRISLFSLACYPFIWCLIKSNNIKRNWQQNCVQYIKVHDWNNLCPMAENLCPMAAKVL